jgi:eukaryotic-like serine/threonine-protein kinase
MTTLTATGQVIAGRYELTRFVAGGAMGEVWEAHDDRMDRTVAVKVMRPEYARDPLAVERFLTEARLAARLAHPGIAVVHDVDDGSSPDDPPWMVQEFVPGRPLSELVVMVGRLEPLRAAGLIAQAADAVHAAHVAGIVHRDLTPGNLLVCDGDVVKITDFGIARASGLPSLTATGQLLGAAAYLSPEQVSGRPASPASDIYTLGVVLYECLAGVRPFSGANPVEVARAHVHQQPTELPASVPAHLRAITAAAMAKDPADRPASAAELAARIREATSSGPASAQTDTRAAWDWFATSSAGAEPHSAPENRQLPRMGPAGQAVDDPADPPPGLVPEVPPGLVPEVPATLVPEVPPGLVPEPPSDVPRKPRSASMPAGAAAVRLATKPAPAPRPSGAGQISVPHRWSAFVRRFTHAWQRYPISRIGLTGGVVILLVVLAVMSGGSEAEGAPAPSGPAPGAGSVPVGNDAGKGDE